MDLLWSEMLSKKSPNCLTELFVMRTKLYELSSFWKKLENISQSMANVVLLQTDIQIIWILKMVQRLNNWTPKNTKMLCDSQIPNTTWFSWLICSGWNASFAKVDKHCFLTLRHKLCRIVYNFIEYWPFLVQIIQDLPIVQVCKTDKEWYGRILPYWVTSTQCLKHRLHWL